MTLKRIKTDANEENCHPGGWLAGVSRLQGCLIKKGTRILFNEQHAWKTLNQVQGDLMITTAGGFSQSSSLPSPRPSSPRSSSRSVGMRDIARGTASGGIGAALYPASARPARTGMTNAASGFTLIELLVVVLIIGILAAVALPQYQKAVEQSRAAQAIAVLSTLYQAAETYALENGAWPVSRKDLDIDFSALNQGEWTVSMQDSDTISRVAIVRTQGKYTGIGFYKYKEHPYPSTIIPREKNLCIEQQYGSTYIFNGEMGSYCNKILNAKPTYVGQSNWANVYELP